MKRLFFNYYLLIIIILLLAKFVAVPLIGYLGAVPFRQNYVHYYQELIRGPYYTIWHYLKEYPEDEWNRRLDDLRPQFGYPLTVSTLSDADFNAQTYRQLLAGEVIVGKRYDTFWQRLGQSNRVLKIGPFPSPGVGQSVNFFTWGLALALLGLVALLYALPFWRRLKEINKTAAAFGEGNLSVRATIPKQSPLAPLAQTFNKMADRIQQLLTSQKQLTNAVSHELRTPLARLHFGLEMLKNAETEEKRTHYAVCISSDIEEMNNLIDELLSYARYDAKQYALQKQDVKLAAWLEKTTERLGEEADARIWLEIAPEARDAVVGIDAKLFRRTLTNLVQNGAKYGRGQVRIVLNTHEQQLFIHIDDDGPGIDPDERERVFEPFSRLESSRSRETGGYGLGLAIVAQIISLHQGSVTASDSDLGGSRFTIGLPHQTSSSGFNVKS